MFQDILDWASIVCETDGKLKNVCLFGVMTKKSELSEKNVPLMSHGGQRIVGCS